MFRKKISLGVILILVVATLTGCFKGMYTDGTYTAETEFDDHGWKGVIEIKVEGNKIVEVDYDEVNEEGQKKSEDQEYSEAMKKDSGRDPKSTYRKLEKGLIQSQDANFVDDVSGATISSKTFKSLAKNTLNEHLETGN